MCVVCLFIFFHMPISRNYFHPRPLCSSNGFATSSRVESNGNRPLIEMSSPNSPQVVYSQLGFMSMNNHREIQHRSYTIPHQEELRQLGALAPTFPANPSVDVQRHLSWDMGTRNSIPPMIPQMYAKDRRERMGSVTPIGFSKSVPNHQAVPKHASSSTNVGYHHQTLKRKAMMTELTLGSPTSFAVESTRNDFFGFAKNCQETQSAKKARAPLLVNEEDANEAIERMAREIHFFPQHMARDLLGNESEFAVYERSSSYTGGFDASLDLSLDLSLNLSSSSSGESSMAMDLSLRLRHNPCP